MQLEFRLGGTLIEAFTPIADEPIYRPVLHSGGAAVRPLRGGLTRFQSGPVTCNGRESRGD
jgi:hypothetical protein